MTDIDSLAAALFGSKRAESQEVLTDATTRTYVGTALTDSKDGTVMVDLGGDVTLPDDVEGVSEHSAEGIEVSTGPGVRAGDEVVVTLVGGTPLKTPMVTGVAGEGDGQNERIHAIEADYVKASTLEADVADIGFLKADSATIKDMQADTAKVHDLTADQLSAATAYIASLNAKSVTAETLAADVAKVHDLTADQLSAAAAYIAQLSADSVTAQRIAAISGDFDAVRANAAKVANLTAAELEADHATIGSLDANYAKITNGHIDSALIDTAAIVDEQVFTVTGNKATISEINAGNIRVRNLHTSNLTVDTADGYVTIGNKQTPTKEFLDSLKDELQQEIDGAVETFTSSAVPLLNNYPASEWVISGATAEEQRKAYAKHVGDICYVQNSALDQNGYAYRFAYDSTEQTFKWVLIKDSDVTKALGDISDLKTFESDTTTWMNETDEGLTTIRQNHTALSGVVDKTVVETKQLWYTKANTTAPSKPTAQVTSTSTAGNAWRVVVPAYNASYPNYYYCLQYKLADGTYAWSDVVRDIAMGESQQQGRKGVADAATAQSTADSATTAAATADGKAVSAQTTANANIKSSVQLWFTKANTTAPNKPTAQVTVNDATKTNQWNLAIPTYSSSYPNYFYCYQQQKGDGTWQWTDVVYDRSITEAQAKAQSALPSSEFNTFKTTTFKEVVDEVDEHSTSISTLSESVSNKADQSTVTTLSNTVNAVKQTADTNKASITNLTQTVNNKADGSTVTTLTNRVSTVEQNLSGITTRVGKTESELDTVSNPNLTPYFSRDKGDVYNASTNPSGYWKTISANYITALDDGWVHISASNSGTSNLFVNYFTAKTSVPKDLVASTKYTFLVETRGVTKSGNVVVYASHHFGSELHAFTSSAGYNVSGEESKYFTVTSASDLSSIACFTRGYVQVPSHGSVDMDIRISLYEGEYSGPYKPYVDQTLSSRVKSAETAIEQNAEDITLRATKTEVYQSAQPNLSPYFQSTPITTDGGYWLYFANSYATFTPTGDGWCRIVLDNKSGTSVKRCDFGMDACPSVEPGKDYTLLYEVRNLACSGSGAQTYVVQAGNELNRGIQFWGNSAHMLLQGHGTNCAVNYINTASGSGGDHAELCDDGIYRKRVVRKSEASDSTYYTRATDKELMRLVAYANAGAYIDVELRVSLYPGVYTGPYKPYSGAQVYASQAELKVANDNINLKVSKNDVINQINVSTEGAKIDADRVEINGTAIFSAIKSSADAAYDAKGAAATVQDNLDNLEVGGRNLLPQTQNWGKVSTSNGTGTITSDTKAGCQILKFVWGSGNADVFFTGKWTRPLEANAWYTLSFWARADAAVDLRNYLWSPAVVDEGRNSVGRTTSSSDGAILTPITTSWERYWIAWHVKAGSSLPNNVMIGRLMSAGTVYFAGAKFEKGNKATDWTPAPEDQTAYVDDSISSIQVGGRNLLQKTELPSSENVYLVRSAITDGVIRTAPTTSDAYADWKVNYLDYAEYNDGEYTVSVDVRLSASSNGYTSINSTIYLGYKLASRWAGTFSSNYDRFTSKSISGITNEWNRVSVTFKVPDDLKSGKESALVAGSFLSVEFYCGKEAAAVDWRHPKLEKGNKVTDWSPAPEDIKSNAVKRTQRIWYRTNASSAPATPGTASSNWVTKADDGNDAWTKMHIAISSTHKYIYTCEQYEMANGTVGYTSVLLDNTITVIDGGNIITGTVTANKLNAANINASKTLTVGAMTDAAASTILNSNVQIGGRNLLLGAATQDTSVGNSRESVNETNDTWLGCKVFRSSAAWADIGFRFDIQVVERGLVKAGDVLTYSIWAKTDDTTSRDIHGVWMGAKSGNSHMNGAKIATLTSEWTRYEKQITVTQAMLNAATVGMATRFECNTNCTSGKYIYWAAPKLEKGNKATDWTPAPEDMATAESLAGTNESLDGAIADIGELSDQLVGTVTEQNKTITDIQTYLNSLRKDLDAEIQSRQQWLNFNAAEGLVIGAAGSTFKTVTTNTSQQFRSGGTVLAETSGTEFVAPVMRSDQIFIGSWMWTRRDNGNLSLKWIG